MTQTLLTAAQITSAVDLAYEDVEVKEWGGAVRLQQLSAEEANAFTREIGAAPDDGMFLMLVYSARSLEGALLFPPDADGKVAQHLPALRKKNIDVLNRLQLIALRLNKMDAAGKAALKKELSEALTGASRIDSPDSQAG